MFAEKALTQIEVGQSELRMNPCNMIERFLYALARLSIVEHDLTCADTAVDVGLPEYA